MQSAKSPSHVSAIGGDQGQDSSPDTIVAKAREQLPLSIGRMVPAMMGLARYRSLPISDLQTVMLDPILANRILVTAVQEAESAPGQPSLIAGFAIWASVSPEVDAKIQEQIAARVFPLRLQAADWVSGEKLWLIDVLAPNKAMAQAVLASFRDVAKTAPVSVHPIVGQSVGGKLLRRLEIDGEVEENVNA